MSIFKCKMCGGALEINNSETTTTCEYCGTQQTLPRLDDDRKTNLYDRANHFRRNNEFDKAMGIYEQILNEDNTDAEAYWSLVLCQYGIEYVEDPATHRRIPTVNRAQFTSIFDDENYKSALQHADIYQKSIYENEAKAINEIQKGILAISQKEEPFDVFICYKESDHNGRRTPDSVLANDLYHQLKQEGFKVFFARITLEDKLGTAYEPYIFAALNSAKVMVVLGTKPEYFNAVWVKNEWSRYLSLIKQGQKKILIPAYKDMNPYDLPEEFSHLQAQDMSKLGFMQDLLRGIKKIVQADEPKPAIIKETVVSGGNANVESLLKRVFMFLEDGEWTSAAEYCEKVLDIEPECARAYLGKLMVDLEVRKQEDLKNCAKPFDKNNNNYQKVLRFADEDLKAVVTSYIEYIIIRNKDSIYAKAVKTMEAADTEGAYKEAAKLFEKVIDYKDSNALAKECYKKVEIACLDAVYKQAKIVMEGADTEGAYREAGVLFEESWEYKDSKILAKECYEKAEILRLDTIYNQAKNAMEHASMGESYEKAAKMFESIGDYKDSSVLIKECYEKAEAARLEEKQREDAIRKANKRKKVTAIIVASVLLVFAVCTIAFMIVQKMVIIPKQNYEKAVSLMNEERYSEAMTIFEQLNKYKDSKELLRKCRWEVETDDLKVGDYITFGTYEQDSDLNNGREDITWVVLAIEDEKAFVVSKYALDGKKYDDSTMLTNNWEKCSLRKWLNDDFFNSAFVDSEKERIPTVELKDRRTVVTEDKVFLLSKSEVQVYLASERRCEGTAYMYYKLLGYKEGDYIYWWLRTPYDTTRVEIIDTVGLISDGAIAIEKGVRPAMWIDISK